MSRRRGTPLACITLAATVAVGGAALPPLLTPDAAAATVEPTRAAPVLTPPSPDAEETGYPRQQQLIEPMADPGDASLRLGLTAYHQIAPTLNDLQLRSQRVSTEVIGQTVTGRELYLVTLTAPESPAQAADQARMRELILQDPEQAARDREVASDYKAPILLTNNIHGNEWEGTDAALRLIEEYATSTDPDIVAALEQSRIHVVVSMNPDGRHGNTRANASGFDLNRDFLTASQPEVVAVRDTIVRTQPLLLIDLHGYVNGTLIEPSTPPHGENYEYDLFIRHAYPNALGIEQAVQDLGYDAAQDGVDPPQIPFRDWDEGWDDWPPIFTPQYAALHGTVAHTVEVPLQVNYSSYNLAEEELQRRAEINTDIAHAAMISSIDYLIEHRAELIADQTEAFRRGLAGEEQVAVTDALFPELGEEDVWLSQPPRAYLLPVREGQRSAPAVARLVDHLIANGVEVSTTREPVTIGDTTYPIGSYLVDLHQAKRGVAHALLGPGTDLSDRVDVMYDIAGWSHGLLWGADVAALPADADLPTHGRAIGAAIPSGRVTGEADLQLRLDDPVDLAAVNSLARSGVSVEWLEDGTVLVPEADQDTAADVASALGATFTPAPDGASGPVVDELVIAAAAPPEERWALDEMGFEVRRVNTTVLNDGFDYTDVDALYLSSDLNWSGLEDRARNDMTRFVRNGGGLVGVGQTGAEVNEQMGLLEVTAHEGPRPANGVVAVEQSGSALTDGATDHTFVYSPLWFTDLGEGVTVEQSYAAEDVLVSGHWIDGLDDAAGEALVVSGVQRGGGAVLFGSEPLFRAHPKGQYALVGRALIWSSLQG